MDEVNVNVEVEVHSTENLAKVKKAVENVFGNIQFENTLKRGRLLIANAIGKEALYKLYNLLRRERIRYAARGAFFEGLSKKSIVFYLNKQVAYVGHISFSQPEAESPLGPIKVEIQCDNPRELIEWLAPRAT